MGILVLCRVVVRINEKADIEHLTQFPEDSNLINGTYYNSLYHNLFLMLSPEEDLTSYLH